MVLQIESVAAAAAAAAALKPQAHLAWLLVLVVLQTESVAVAAVASAHPASVFDTLPGHPGELGKGTKSSSRPPHCLLSGAARLV